jgi:hypothetical protein
MAKVPTEIKSLARSYTELAIQTLAGIIQNGTQDSARVSAAQVLLDRGWGKATQPIDGDGDGGPVQLTVTWQKK